jgi:hypothetical protein
MAENRKPPRLRVTRQTCYSYTPRELAEALGLPLTPYQWVVVELDNDGPGEPMIDILVRETES